MRTLTKPSVQRRTAVAGRSSNGTPRSFAELETVTWDTRIDFPPQQKVGTIRARFVEVPSRPFTTSRHPRD